MKRAVLTILLAALSAALPTSALVAAPVKGVKKLCPDGSYVPYKRACPTPAPVTTPPTLSVQDYTVSESGGFATITVTKSTTYSVGSNVNYATSNGTATAGSDYTATSGTLTIPAGSLSATFTVPILDDTADEGNETINVTLSSPVNSSVADGSGVITIINGDDPVPPPPPPPPAPDPVPALSIVNSSFVESTGTASITVMASVKSTKPITYHYSTSNGTATAGSDYTFGAANVTIPAGTQTSIISVPILNDSTDEVNETFNVTISPVDNSTVSVATGTYTIIDDDDPPTVPGLSGVASEGDSISQSWGSLSGGSHTGMYKAANPSLNFCGLAVGGSVIGSASDGNALNNPTRLAAVDACHPKVFTVLIGANDLVSWDPNFTAQVWLDRLYTYTDRMRAKGYKVLVGTVLPQIDKVNTNIANYGTVFNQKRAVVNADLRAKVGTRIDGVIDFAADATMGVDSAPNNTSLYIDGLHPTDGCGVGCGGQGKLYVIYKAAVDAALAGGSQTPTPPPATDIAAESLEGLTWRLVPHDYNKDLQPAWGNGQIPGQEDASDPVGAFRLTCGNNGFQYNDPILYPGNAGRSHFHNFNGKVGVDQNTTFTTQMADGNSTCNFNPTGSSSQNSSYWMPALLDGKGFAYQPDWITVYYKRIPKFLPLTTTPNPDCGAPTGQASGPLGICTEIPNGLRVVAGSKMVAGQYSTNWRLDAPQGNYVCGKGGAAGPYGNLVQLSAGAPLCTEIQYGMNFPNCWDGLWLWKADRSHVIYPKQYSDGRSRCPPSNPYLITTVTVIYNYTQINPADLTTIKLASDYMDPGQPRGWSIHSDMMIAWDARVKRMFHDNCIDKHLNCSGGDLGNGLQLIGAAQPRYDANGLMSLTAPFTWANPKPKIAEPAMPPNMVMP